MITLEDARRIIAAAETKAKQIGQSMNIAVADAPEEIKRRHIGNCAKADPAYGVGVASALGISMSEVKK